MMPSASKFKRPYLPAVMAGKAAQSGYSSCLPPIWQAPRSLSNSSLPPKNSEPITMPSFAKMLPGTKRAMASPSNHHLTSQFQPPSSSCFPLIPNQQTFQTVATHNVNLNNQQAMYIHQHQPQMMEQQQMHVPTSSQMNPTYLNPYTTTAHTMHPPQMAYQMINMSPSQYQSNQQQQYNYLGCSGDNNAMASAMQQIQLQQQQQNFEQTTMAYQFQQQQQYPQQVFQTDMFQYSQQPPYAVQSMPCFGTPCTSSNGNACGVPNFPMSPSNNDKTAHDIIHQSLPESPQPVYSVSMPEICLGAQNPQHCNSHHMQMRNTKKCLSKATNSSGGKKEVSIVVEDSSSASTSSSSEEENEPRKEKPKSVGVLKLREIQKVKEENKAKEDAKYATLGPESTPDKIPTKQRLAHTPIRIKLPMEEPEFEVNFEEKEEECSQDKESSANCKCCQKKATDIESESNDKQQPQSLDEKVKELKNKLTPRKKGKPVVVAVHDIFPSDSSMSEPESDLDSARKSCFNYVGSNGSMVRKRKPRMESILKMKLKGDSSEVFDDLENDLNPDEARTYTGDYLVELLTSDDWNNCYTALQIMVRLARHRPKVLLNHLNGPILWYTFKHITSPKSALCRAAIVTFKELFQSIGSALDNELDKITEKLVLKSLAPNMFIREECDRALEAMVGHCNLVKVLNAMDIVSKKPHSRAAGHRLARMALQIVQVAGVDVCLKPVYAEKLLPMLFSYMTEANNGTRCK